MKLNIQKLIDEKQQTRYWLWSQTSMSYKHFNKMLDNETKSISFANIKLFCEIFECTPNDLFGIN